MSHGNDSSFGLVYQVCDHNVADPNVERLVYLLLARRRRDARVLISQNFLHHSISSAILHLVKKHTDLVLQVMAGVKTFHTSQTPPFLCAENAPVSLVPATQRSASLTQGKTFVRHPRAHTSKKAKPGVPQTATQGKFKRGKRALGGVCCIQQSAA